MRRIKVFEGFAGYGGASFALKRLEAKYKNVNFKTVGYSEIEPSAIALYDFNHRQGIRNLPIKNWGDIKAINPEDPKFPNFDLFTGGFPCQPFSTAGKGEGELDARGTLFAEIIRICEVKQPKYILLENVKGLTLGKHKPTFEKILAELGRIGYDVRCQILNSKDYGIPQNRERLWIFCSLQGLPFDFSMQPPTRDLIGEVKDFLDLNPSQELYRTQEQINHIKQIHGIDFFDVPEPLCYDYYNRKIRTDGICMTITPPNHNVVRLVEPSINGNERFRKLSIDEQFRFMGFEINENRREINYPQGLNYLQLGERAGNGWDINLVEALCEHIFRQLGFLKHKR